ncbi:FAD-binding oxidoreductase [Methylocaldum sp. RMAD-M]|uniref:FAD-binding oxidoreductase n=1 Tax=Methylocaldum sp. RMAD-M TaxID=2806557 RepID=UPI001AE2DE59|nr:FAD-binding oxidoreductase [Methylocaldum sp. RMAD-M]MBP1150394.1 FAD/FMN-containing dehydrogenase [Methylocaldum sp. RMAD-M]
MSIPPRSWNRIPTLHHAKLLNLTDRSAPLPSSFNGSLLAHGNGRSYGDVCLNEGGTLLLTQCMNHFIAFDRATGRLCCEAGVLLKEILDLVVPQGWFLPVTPGTRFVTVGGAIANDVHGKNHHLAGSFGHHVVRLELLRSDGSRIVCSPTESNDWFAATVGGLGLTGLITWAELQLIPVANAFMWVESRRFTNLEEFWTLNEEAESRWPYTVAWIDCLYSGGGRGIFISGSHAPPHEKLPVYREKSRRLAFDPPFSLVNRLSLRAFNAVYYYKPLKSRPTLTHYTPYFYPLDGLLEWNRIYGRRGFFQYQCVLPPQTSREGVAELLRRISASGQGSFLAVLKTFGHRQSHGLLSFPRPGVTLALDFPNLGERTHRLFRELDAVIRDARGALYPAKDARMPAEMFRAGYPHWERFSTFIDPRFSSSFWRRVAS